MQLRDIPGGGVTVLIGGVAVLVTTYVLAKKATGDNRSAAGIIAGDLAAGAVTAAGDAVTGAAGGVVVGLGQVVGLPATDAARCELAKKKGDALAVSLYCKAPDFLAWSAQRVFTGGTPKPTTKPGTVAAPKVRAPAKPAASPSVLFPDTTDGRNGSFSSVASPDADLYTGVFGKLY